MELVDVYNERKELMGVTKDKKSLGDNEYRLSTFIWIINSKKELLIQQRTKDTKKMPNMWGATAGAVREKETALAGAIREVKEEIGIDTLADEYEYIGSYKRIKDFVEVFLLKKDIELSDVVIDEREVQAVKYVSVEKFKQMIEDNEAIDSGFNVLDFYYNNFYNKHYEIHDGIPVIVENEN